MSGTCLRRDPRCSAILHLGKRAHPPYRDPRLTLAAQLCRNRLGCTTRSLVRIGIVILQWYVAFLLVEMKISVPRRATKDVSWMICFVTHISTMNSFVHDYCAHHHWKSLLLKYSSMARTAAVPLKSEILDKSWKTHCGTFSVPKSQADPKNNISNVSSKTLSGHRGLRFQLPRGTTAGTCILRHICAILGQYTRGEGA